MLDSFELEINTYLRAGRPVSEIARSLRELWERGGLSHYDQNVIALFLAKSGQHNDLFSLTQTAIEKESRIPWLALLESFREKPSDLSKTVLNQVMIGCGVENRLAEIGLATAGETIDGRFKKLKEQAFKEQLTKKEETLSKGLERLDQLRRDRLFDAEEKWLDKLHTQFPTHPKVISEYNTLKGRKALGMLERRNRMANHARVINELVNPLSEEKLDAQDQAWAENFTVLARENPKMAYDLGIALIQMGLPELALQALNYSAETRERDSLILDLMIETRQFVNALEFADRFDQNYKLHSDSAFTAMYARARSMWGLGEKNESINLLAQLLKLRPTYRSAHALLLEWKGVAS